MDRYLHTILQSSPVQGDSVPAPLHHAAERVVGAAVAGHPPVVGQSEPVGHLYTTVEL